MATAKANENAATKKDGCYFFRLPRELTDNIFSLAYVHPNSTFPVKTVTRQGRMDDIDMLSTLKPSKLRLKKKAAQHFRTGGCCQFLVSKKWLAEAGRVYLEKTTFELKDTFEVARFLTFTNPLPTKLYVQSILFEYFIPRNENIVYWSEEDFHAMQTPPARVAPFINQCSKLRNVTVTYDWIRNANHPFRVAIPHQYIMVQHSKFLEDVMGIRGLRVFKLLQHTACYNMHISYMRSTLKKVAKAEAEIQQEVVKPRD